MQAAQLENVLENLGLSENKYKQRFLVKVGDKFVSIPIHKIAYFYTEDKGVYLYTYDKVRYAIDYSLDELERLVDPNNYFRLNRQYIAHVDSVARLNSFFNGKLKVYLDPDPGYEIIVSREKASAFKQWLDR